MMADAVVYHVDLGNKRSVRNNKTSLLQFISVITNTLNLIGFYIS